MVKRDVKKEDIIRRVFNKPASTASELIAFLRSKGLIINDSVYAEHCLKYIGYYRLKIYTRAFEIESPLKRFKLGTTFGQILEVYDFDRNLRLHCLDAIERIEVALRSRLINVMSHHGGAHFYYEERFFENKEAVTSMRKIGSKSNYHPSIDHYNRHYHTPHLPPIWCLTEASSFGDVSRLFANLELQYRKEIASDFGIAEGICVSWMRCLSTLRNICAHHGHLWNANLLVNAPVKAKKYSRDMDTPKVYSRLVIMCVLLKNIDPNDQYGWKPMLKLLIENRPSTVSLPSMGFPSDWRKRPVWR